MYDGTLVITYHSHGARPEQYTDAIHTLLVDIPSRYAWATE